MNLMLISHGEFAEGLLDTAEMILGKIDKVQTVCLYPHEGTEDFRQKFEQALARTDGETVVLCDIIGGTPCNVAMRYLDRISLFSGMNLPMVISVVSEGTADLLENARSQIYDVAAQLKQIQTDEDE
ncbi:PTS sugar transporter subunit IIA [Muribacter muris]|uniref:PTS sugar transporter subunit IIA n=1 Tax=Muribacter muris TaxID=67855 RepID=A0A4Y9JRT7_9PAST|nr:PTS sugar transporter subunit IIA [Muribacter muris]MBF0785835.1 PTS sugar transporter subunit IIA [Muribacter muris]MBF0827092.1 PTS sugar transporter subunit IIA [Muribacter muris]TFV08534.1 PTS sugar transporter subunit IIA [Muribacter muris]